MAIATPFHGLATELHMLATTSTAADNTTKIAEVASIGTLELSANIIEYNKFGTDYKQKLVGQKDSGTLSLTLNWVCGDASHTELKSVFDSGDKQVFAVKWVSGSEDAQATFSGYVSGYSIETPVEDVVTANIEIAIDGAVAFALA